MPASSERPDTIGIDELRMLETSVLKTLCLTINTAGSELKYKILDSLSDDDFYFPVLQTIFQTLADMHLRGDYVISKNLEQELLKSGLEFPPGFSIDTLFAGTLPSLADLSAWVFRLKERSLNGLVPTLSAAPKDLVKPLLPGAEATVVKSVAEVKKKIADEFRKSTTPPPAERPSPVVVAKPRLSPTPEPREKSPAPAAVVPKPKPARAVLSSEGDDWSSYLEDLASQQGKSFDTGFLRLDRELGGLSPGLMLLVDEDRGRVVNFLKQVTDQVASSTGTHCLFVTSEFPKSDLRLRTLSRLAMVPIQYIQKGRLKKDSPDWQKVDRAGRGAAGWLRRVYVYEQDSVLELALLKELARKLLESAEGKPCLMVLDSLEKVEKPAGLHSVSVQLKNLAASTEVLLLAATTDPTLLASKDTDYAGVFHQAAVGLVELEILRAGRDSSTIARLRYEPAICRFSEAE